MSPAEALGSATWPEVGSRSSAVALVVPVGSLEQHGPHLPLDSDARIAHALAAALAADRGWWLAPPLAYGASGEHAGFPGTISVGERVLTDTVVELVRSVRTSCRGTVVVSGHGGNARALARADAVARAEGDRLLVWHPRVPGGDAHAGRSETSILLALSPDAVRMERAEPGRTEPIECLMDMLVRHGTAVVSPNGVLGDPRAASADEGRMLLDQLRHQLADAVEAWWKENGP